MSEKNKVKNDDISLLKKILMLVGSLFIALVLWYVGTTQDHTPISKRFTDIPVVYRGDEILRQNGFLVDDLENVYINVVLRGDLSELFLVNNDDLVAVVDVSMYDKSGKYTIAPIVEGISGDVTVSKVDSIDIEIEKLVRKQLAIEVELSGKAYRGYEVDEEQIQVTKYVEILCREDISDKIVGAKVDVNIDGKKKTFTVNVNIKFVDADGNDVDSDGITADFESVNVTVPIKTAD